jgi:hypothetical protein
VSCAGCDVVPTARDGLANGTTTVTSRGIKWLSSSRTTKPGRLQSTGKPSGSTARARDHRAGVFIGGVSVRESTNPEYKSELSTCEFEVIVLVELCFTSTPIPRFSPASALLSLYNSSRSYIPAYVAMRALTSLVLLSPPSPYNSPAISVRTHRRHLPKSDRSAAPNGQISHHGSGTLAYTLTRVG